jgi:uncharacterized protein YqhQ
MVNNKKGVKEKVDIREVWMRIPIFIVSGFILYVWGFFVLCFALAQFILILIERKKNKDLLKMCETYYVQFFIFVRYIFFLSNKRPFPFGDLEKEIEYSE